MKIPVQIETIQVSIEKLMPFYKYDEVLGYCQNCSNYGGNYSCPGFEFDTVEMLKAYKYATIVLTKIDTEIIRADEASFNKHIYESQVYKNYVKGQKDVAYDWQTGLAMYAFNEVKDWMSDQLLLAEEQMSDTLSLPPGSCTRCEECYKKQGQPCVQPDKLRYSFEALGFLVSDIYKEILGLELGWTKGELSKVFHTCSALLSKEPLDIERLNSVVGNKSLTVRQSFETERLLLRPFVEKDAKDLHEYLSNEEVVAYEPYGVFSLEEAEIEALDRGRNDAFYAVVLKETGKMIGNIYFNKSQPEYVESYEIGYVFNPKFGGNGYATEAAKCLVSNAFDRLNAHRIVAYCNTENTASWKLLERLGMRREATRLQNMFFERDHAGLPMWFDSYQYAILKGE